jgi:hypothetical protein
MNIEARVLRQVGFEWETGFTIYKRVAADGHGRTSLAEFYIVMRGLKEERRLEEKREFDADGPLAKYRLT